MKNVLIVCNAGMSSNLLVTKMQKYAMKNNFNTNIEAVSVEVADRVITSENIDVVLFGPQVRFLLNKFKEKYPNQKMDVISIEDYGILNGENVFKQALKLSENNWA